MEMATQQCNKIEVEWEWPVEQDEHASGLQAGEVCECLQLAWQWAMDLMISSQTNMVLKSFSSKLYTIRI